MLGPHFHRLDAAGAKNAVALAVGWLGALLISRNGERRGRKQGISNGFDICFCIFMFVGYPNAGYRNYSLSFFKEFSTKS